MTRVNMAIIGFGGIGEYWSTRLPSTNLNLVGVYDILETRNSIALEKGLKVYSSRKELLNDEDIEMIMICTPNDSHCEIAIDAMRHGKHVLCEKPAAMNIEELKLMISESEKQNVKFTVNQCRRQDVDYLTAKDIIDKRIIGDVFHIESKVIGSRGIPGDWRKEKEHGGGMLFDWGVHTIDQVVQMFDDKIDSLYATFSHVTNEEVDDGFTVTLKYNSGRTVLLEVGTCHFIIPPRWYICGNNGSASIGMWTETGEVRVLKSWENSDVKPIKAASGFTKTMAPRDENEEITITPIKFVENDENFIFDSMYDAIKFDKSLIVTHESLLETFKIIEAIFESAKDNKVIKF